MVIKDLPVSKQRSSGRTVGMKHQPILFETWDLENHLLSRSLGDQRH